MRVKKSTVIYTGILLSLALMFCLYSGFCINITNSLPYKLFLMDKISKPAVGSYVSFKAPAASGFSEEVIITKKILAGPGDVVTKKNDDFYINHKWVARAKRYSLEGQPLEPGPEGKLQTDQYYVSGQHPDSLDSRYGKIGWIRHEQIIAVAHPIF